MYLKQSEATASLQLSSQRKRDLLDHFEKNGDELDRWREFNAAYHADDRKFMQFLIPPGKRVLELGCGRGDLLAALKPSYGVGIDFSAETIAKANARHPDLHLVLGDVEDPQTLAEILHLRSKQPKINYIATADFLNLMDLADFEVIREERRQLLPRRWLGLGPLINRFIAPLPGIRQLCLRTYIVGRPVRQFPDRKLSASILIPCRNEKGNIENAILRMPQFGSAQEILFVEGNSSDGTYEECERVRDAYKDSWDIKVLKQDGKGKGDAVRKGFAAATGDVLMILDADLTMPPEALPKYHAVIETGKAEFVNGTRLIYPMEHEAMRPLNLIANRCFAYLFSYLVNTRLTDTLCGTKVLLRKDYEMLARERGYFGDFDPFGDFDLIFGAAKQNLKIIETPIHYKARTFGETQISRFRDGWLLLRMVWFAYRKLKAI